MEELKKAITRIFSSFNEKSKYTLAKQLADTLELTDTRDLQGKVEEILDRQLSAEEVFIVDTLSLILRDNAMFIDVEPGDEAAKSGF
ncbi:MAG: hypothetical protein GY847_09740 [Proteobacteria bacterium]|nr:hypothetical protein [Pseudomonadota bacterium]